ncbi:MAG: four helix bundle protein [Thermomicrobiales bacterium]|nr:four helix bundle protein [Thermomicrobiales bacterium]
MTQVKSYRDLRAWQSAMDFVVLVYRESDRWPATEQYGLTQQVRRCSVSVPSNIAEGQGRRNDREFARFLRIAHGSLQEAETQIMLARRLGYCEPETEDVLLAAAGDLGRMIQGLVRIVARSSADDR